MRITQSALLGSLAILTLAAPQDSQQSVVNCFKTNNIPQSNPFTQKANFTTEIVGYNLRIPVKPVALAFPTTVAQVQDAVTCAVKNKLPVSARSGGHSYANHGIGGEDGHVVIDMKRFNHIDLDKTTNIVTAGPGVRLGNIATHIYNDNKRALSHGTCPTVGLGGHSLLGGYGFASRTWGLMTDSLVGAKVVLANGTAVNASADENSDLFWALRGAGSSYGIVVEYQFQTFAAPESEIVFNYPIKLDGDSFVQALSALQTYSMNDQPKEMNLRFTARSTTSSLLGVYYGSMADYRKAIQPMLDIFPTPTKTNVKEMSWIDGLVEHASQPLDVPYNFKGNGTFFAKSMMSDLITDDAWAAFKDFYNEQATNHTRNWFVEVDAHGGPTSAITQMTTSDTSYAQRNAVLKWQFYDRNFGTHINDPWPKGGNTFMNQWMATLTSNVDAASYGMYYGYPDTSLGPQKAHHYYYLNNYDRLSSIKSTVDPDLVFANPQSVNRNY